MNLMKTGVHKCSYDVIFFFPISFVIAWLSIGSYEWVALKLKRLQWKELTTRQADLIKNFTIWKLQNPRTNVPKLKKSVIKYKFFGEVKHLQLNQSSDGWNFLRFGECCCSSCKRPLTLSNSLDDQLGAAVYYEGPMSMWLSMAWARVTWKHSGNVSFF